MRHKFLTEVTNVQRFLAGTKRVQMSGAPEACWQLCQGEAGFGKTSTLEWHAVQGGHVLLRAKSSWTLTAMLRELVVAVGHQPIGKNNDLLHILLSALAGSGRSLIVDEIEHAMRDIRLIEMLRDISDLTLTPIIVAGHAGTSNKLKRYHQIFSRLSDVTEFGPATPEDVRTVCSRLAELKGGKDLRFKDDLVTQIHSRTRGRMRDIKKAVANVEAIALRMGVEEIGLAEVPLSALTSDGLPSELKRRA
ncbi:MAG: ATP-binding protein [Parvibaculaceae bacterium]|nr:ATP-binding protein [Parvibaculaceae bacterium]